MCVYLCICVSVCVSLCESEDVECMKSAHESGVANKLGEQTFTTTTERKEVQDEIRSKKTKGQARTDG